MPDLRFAHIADCHLGAWGSHPELHELPLKAFAEAIDKIIKAEADFVLLAGDFFDSSMPAVDVLRFAVEQLMRLKQADIPVYAIAGSHDYSPTGKTMLSVLEAAGLVHNAHMKWLLDDDVRIFGIEGLRGGLDREYFDKPASVTNSSRPSDARYTIFMFHSAVDEISGMAGVSLEALPKGFDYYATGHVHAPRVHMLSGKPLVFPGPLFPAEFSELEQLGVGSFCIADVEGGKTSVSTIQIQLAPVRTIEIACDGKSPQQIEAEFSSSISARDVGGKIVLLKASGTIAGKPTDINWRAIGDKAKSSGAFAVKRSVHLSAAETAITKPLDVSGGLEHIEKAIIERNAGSDSELVLKLMDVLAVEKAEDEKNLAYEEKIKSGIRKVLGVDA